MLLAPTCVRRRAPSRVLAMVVLSIAGSGCGDDAMVMPDAGPGSDGGAPADAGGDPTVTLRARFVDPDGTPLDAVHVAFDTPSGRVEGTSGMDGTLDTTIMLRAGETVDFTAAKERFIIASNLDVPFEELDLTGRPDFVLEPQRPGGDPVTIRASVTGVPPGGKLCTSFDGWALCGAAGATTASYVVPTELVGDEASVFVLDDAGDVFDFEVVSIDGTPEDAIRTFSTTADGTPASAPVEVREVTLRLGGTGSELHTAELPPEWAWWFGEADADTGRWLGVCSHPVRDGNTLRLRYTRFPAGAARTSWHAAVWTHLTDFSAVSFNNFDEDPGTSADVLGLAAVASGARLTDAFAITPPPAPAGEELLYGLRFRNGSRIAVWRVISRSPDSLRVPELPSGYDREVSFPFAGSTGDVTASPFVRAPEGMLAQRLSFGVPAPVTF